MSDNLESYFKKHLRDDTPVPEEWNVPSDNVWAKVQPEIYKRKGIFIPWKYLYILGIGLVLLVSTLFLLPENAMEPIADKNVVEIQSENEIQTETKANISDVVQEKESKGAEADNQKAETPNSTMVSENASNNVTLIQKTPENITNSESNVLTEQTEITVNERNQMGLVNENDSPDENTISATIAIAFAVNGGVEESNENNSTSAFNASDNYSANANRSTADIEKSESDVFVYSSMIVQFPEDQSRDHLKGYDYLNKQKARPITYSPGKFGVGAYYAPTYTSTEVNGLELPGNDQMGNTFLFSNNWGFDFYYYLSYRFTLVSGIGSAEIRSWSKTTNQFNYDSSTEHDMGNNQTANGTEQTSPTPFGSLSSEVVYSFPSDANIPDGELMESVSETFQNIRYLSIPLGIEYNLLNQEKSLWFLETGFNYNISMRDKTELLPQIMHEGEEMNIMDSRITQNPNYENNYWGFYIGTGYKYPVSDRIQLFGTVRYNRSISPLKSIESATTNIEGYQLKVGVVFLLH